MWSKLQNESIYLLLKFAIARVGVTTRVRLYVTSPQKTPQALFSSGLSTAILHADSGALQKLTVLGNI